MLRIRELRESLDMTQQDLANKLGVARNTISVWETGVSCPSVRDLPRLAAALSCEISDLYALNPKEPSKTKHTGGEDTDREKIQTGLRIPAKRYEELQALSAQVGVSLNALILMLVDFALSLRKGSIIPPQE